MSQDEEVFAAARELPPSERAKYLERACAGDPALQGRVEELFAGYEESQRAFAEPFVVRGRVALEEAAGHRIGRYKLLQKIGEGGCGVVWMAEQEEPVRRRVALKVIKLGMDTKAVVARFEAERQALAMMDHPNIARVYDAGATDAGRPYFVMELVRGITITKYCDENHLTPVERLELFVKVCQAVQHAHQKGVIHRDLKPSNILVTLNDGVPTPKVIDFGVAKATQGRLTDSTLFTAFEQFIGTPVYMSPEQAELSSLDIDTRSDIYSLGILLYELLTGQPPFDPKAFAKVGVAEIRHHIVEDEPPKPSTRWQTLGEAERTTLARLRSIAPSRLSVILRGDLDWIVMRCIEKDRTRRYDTASGIAADIERHLRHEPVVARPPGRAYLARKWIRRHRVGFAAAAAIAMVLSLGVFVSTWQAWRATRAERLALAAQRNEAHLRQKAEAQELIARRRAYGTDMHLVQQALDEDDCIGARELLDRHRPAPGQLDLRDWEWRWLWKRSEPETDEELGKLSATDAGLQRWIWSLASSPDGNWLAAGTFGQEAGGIVAMWDLRRRRNFEFRVGDAYTRVAFSPTEPLLAVSAHTGGESLRSWVELWRYEITDDGLNGHVEQRLDLGEVCSALVFSKDGNTLITSTFGEWRAESRLPTITHWRVRDGDRLRSVRTPATSRENLIQDRHYHFAISPDLQVAAYEAEQRKEFRVIDLNTGEERWHGTELDGNVVPFAFSPDGTLLASGDGQGGSLVHLWDVANGKELGRYEGHRGWVSSLAFWPDGKMLTSGGTDGTIRQWKVPRRDEMSVQGSGFRLEGSGFGSWRPLRTFRGHGAWRLEVLPGSELIVNSGSHMVRLWKTPQVETDIQLETLGGITAANDFVGEDSKKLRWVAGWRFAGDSRSLFTLHHNGILREWGIPGFRLKREINIDAVEAFYRSFSRPARTLPPALFGQGSPLVAIGSAGTGKVSVFDFERRLQVSEIKVSSGQALPVRFLGDDNRLLIYDPGLASPSYHEWDLGRGVEVAKWSAPDRNAPVIALTPDERHAVMLSRDGNGIVRDMIGGTLRAVQLAPGRAAGFSPDGRVLAVATLARPGRARLWEFPQLAEKGTLSHLSSGMLSVGFSPDGKRFAAGSTVDVAVRIWDVEGQQPVLTLPRQGQGRTFDGPPTFSPDGSVLGALCTFPSTLLLWRAPSWAEIEATEKAAAAAGPSGARVEVTR